MKPLLHFLARSACTLDRLNIQGALLALPDDLIQILAHKSCNSLASLTISQRPYDPGPLLVNNEVLTSETYPRPGRLIMHPSEVFITQFSTPTCGTLEPRICSILDENQKDYLKNLRWFSIILIMDKNFVKRSGMEYRLRRARWTMCNIR